MLSPRISHDLPVMNSFGERTITNYSPEVVIGFTEEEVSTISTELDFSRGVLRIPCEFIGEIVPLRSDHHF